MLPKWVGAVSVPVCIICLQTVAIIKSLNIKQHYQTKHKIFSEKYLIESNLQKSKIESLCSDYISMTVQEKYSEAYFCCYRLWFGFRRIMWHYRYNTADYFCTLSGQNPRITFSKNYWLFCLCQELLKERICTRLLQSISTKLDWTWKMLYRYNRRCTCNAWV